MMPSKINQKEIIVMAKFADHVEKTSNGVVTGYKKIENGVVEGFGKVTDKCIEVLFAKDGESVEEAKARLSGTDKE